MNGFGLSGACVRACVCGFNKDDLIRQLKTSRLQELLAKAAAVAHFEGHLAEYEEGWLPSSRVVPCFGFPLCGIQRLAFTEGTTDSEKGKFECVIAN